MGSRGVGQISLNISELLLSNQALLNRYPFLKIHTGDCRQLQILELIPCGWKYVVILMCEDLRKILINNRYLGKYKITDMKEKYGNLSVYDNGHFEQMEDIITKYETLSEYICCDCGKPDVSLVNNLGYVQPLCRSCLEKRITLGRQNGLSINNGMTYESLAYRQENNQKMPDKIVIKHFKNGAEYPEAIDCTAEINRIRSAYKYHRQEIDYVCGIDIK